MQVHEKTVCHLVSEGFVGIMPPHRGNPGSIPEGAYKGLKDALTSFISIHQASGKHEFLRSELSTIVNEVISSNSRENRRGNKLLKRLAKDFGPELMIGKSQKQNSTE